MTLTKDRRPIALSHLWHQFMQICGFQVRHQHISRLVSKNQAIDLCPNRLHSHLWGDTAGLWISLISTYFSSERYRENGPRKQGPPRSEKTEGPQKPDVRYQQSPAAERRPIPTL